MDLAIIALLAYLATVILLITVLKRGVSEAMVVSFLVLCLFAGTAAPAVAWQSFSEAAMNPIVFSVVMFVFMGVLFDTTGIIHRQIAILNSVLGRVPGGAGYVSTVASGLFGSVSHGGSANAAAVGAVTVPWMKQSGWPSHVAATMVAGNAGIGHVIPPSPSLLLLLGMSAVAPFADLGSVFIPLMIAAAWIMLYRLAITYYFVRRHRIGKDKRELPSFGAAFKNGYTTLLVFLGILIPLFISLGPVSSTLEARVGEDAMKAINIVLWIPMLMLVLTILLGLKKLPKRPRDIARLASGTAPAYVAVGATVLFAFAASEVLTAIGLGEAMNNLLESLNANSIVLLIVIGVAMVLVAGPLPAAATTATLGSVAFTALTESGIAPVAAIAAILIFASTEGASPPAGAPIYIASGQAEVNPVKTFRPLVLLYVLPFIAIGVLIGSGIIPIA